MVVRFAALMCIALGGGFVSATEPPSADSLTESADLTKQIEAAIEKLQAARHKFEFVSKAVGADLDDARRAAVLIRLEDCETDVTKARHTLRLAVVKLRLLTLKYAIAWSDDWHVEWLAKLADRTQRITGDKEPNSAPLPKALAQLDALRRSLTKGGVPKAEVFKDAEDNLAAVLRDTTRVFSELDRVLSKEHLIEMLKEIVANQSRLRYDFWPPHVPPEPAVTPIIGETRAVVLAKGGKATLQHTIEWRQYKEEDLEVTITASDPSLRVPQKLKLEFEKHQFRFEYEIRAGDKVGDFTVTLQPASGNAVVVQVTVK